MRNVAFGLELRGVAKAERERVAESISGESASKDSRMPIRTNCPGGMRQRVGLRARSPSTPKVVLMDEPSRRSTSRPAASSRRICSGSSRNERKTFIFVTHSIEEAVYVSDRIVLLSRGRAGSRRSSTPRSTARGDPETDPPPPAYLDTVEAIWQGLKHYLD